MRLRKNKLKERIESLESELGLFYTFRDSEGYAEHKLEEDGYSILNRMKKQIKELQEQVEKNTKKGKK